jgi:hypothetical protein
VEVPGIVPHPQGQGTELLVDAGEEHPIQTPERCFPLYDISAADRDRP